MKIWRIFINPPYSLMKENESFMLYFISKPHKTTTQSIFQYVLQQQLLLNSSSEIINCCSNCFCGILAQALSKYTFKDCAVVCGVRQASVFNMDQTLKSIGLWSDDGGVHNFLLQNCGKLSLHQAWVLLEVWEGALSCWKVKYLFLKCSFISHKAGAKMSSMYLYFGTLFHKSQRRYPSFWHCSPNHDRCWLMAAING